MFKWILLSAFVAFFFSCSESPMAPGGGVATSLNGAFILNEGAWGQNNGSLSFYDFESKTIQNNIYEAVNGEKLGDVAHSMTIIDTLGFIVINGSDSIKVISINSWKKVASIGFPAGSGPRYLAQVAEGKAYVTMLLTNAVSILDLNTYQITKTIPVGANPEQLVVADGKAYVACSGFGYGNTVSMLDVASDAVVNTITVGDNPVAVAKFGPHVYVQCGGSYGDFSDPLDDTDGGIYAIDIEEDQVNNSVAIPGHPSGLSIANGNAYIISGDRIDAYKLPFFAPLGATAEGSFYDLAVDQSSTSLFALDPLDYAQAGNVHIFGLSGGVEQTLKAGIIPGEVVFVYATE